VQNVFQRGGREVFARLVPLIFLGLTLLIVIQRGNQIDYLFLAYGPLKGFVLPAAAALFCGWLLLLLGESRMARSDLLDFPIFAAPAVLFCWKWFVPQGHGAAAAAGGEAAALSLLVFLSYRWLAHREIRRTPLVLGLWVVSVTICSITVVLIPVSGPVAVGSIAIVTGFFGLLLVAIRMLLVVPRWGAIAGCVLVVWFLIGGNEHWIKQRQLSDDNGNLFEVNESIRPYFLAKSAFAQWLLNRSDLTDYYVAGKPYPVFFVASEGGGGYAAAHSYLFLTKLQRRCPNFLQHTFALIGVSGGAIGNSMVHASFAADANGPKPRDCALPPIDAARQTFPNLDLLSPVLGTMLFRDFPNRFVFGTLGSYDRSDALADAIRTIWSDRGYDPNYLNHFWALKAGSPHPGIRGGPAVINVATNVTSGSRYLFAPFVTQLDYGSGRFEQYLPDLNADLDPIGATTEVDAGLPGSADVKFFETAVTSAAFPWMSPSRFLKIPYWNDAAIALVDGGYFEGTGAETLADLYTEISQPTEMTFQIGPDAEVEKLMLERGCERIALLHEADKGVTEASLPADCVIRFSLNAVVVRTEVDDDRFARGSSSFFTDPLAAILSTRGQRSRDALMTLLDRMCPGCGPLAKLEFSGEGRLFQSTMVPGDLSLPLGWTMPASSIAVMDTVVVPDDVPDFQGVTDEADLAQILDNQRFQNFNEVKRLTQLLAKP
jgi:hypothetical protein